MSMVDDGTPATPAVFRAGDQFDMLRRNEQTGEYDRVRVVVTGAGLPAAIPEGFSYVLYLSETQAQALVERTRGGGSAVDDAP